MQRDDIGLELPQPPCINELDSALHELGMLSTRTNSRQQYLNEIQNKSYLNMVTINTRYVSNVSIGFKVRPMTPHVRYKPYIMPKERHRTRSENNDGAEQTTTSCSRGANAEEYIPQDIEDINNLKKAKSLESIVIENNQNINLKDVSFSNCVELESVSNSIQNLRVVE